MNGSAETSSSTFAVAEFELPPTPRRRPGGGGDGGRAVARTTSLRLASNPRGPSALNARGGNLGQTALPLGFALDADGTLFLLDRRGARPSHPDRPRVLRFEPCGGAFERVPGMGGTGTAPGRFNRPVAIAATCDMLAVAEFGNRRVQVFERHTGTLLMTWSWGAGERPIDVAAAEDGSFFILLRRKGPAAAAPAPRTEVLRSAYPLRPPHRVAMESRWHWSRLVINRAGNLYLLRSGLGGVVDVYEPPRPSLHPNAAAPVYQRGATPREYRFVDSIGETGTLAQQLGQVPLVLDPRGYFRWGDAAAPKPRVAAPLAPPAEGSPGRIFDRYGNEVPTDLAEPMEWPTPFYTGESVFVSSPIDSGIYRCTWDRLELDVERVPPGTVVEVSALAGDDEHAFVRPDEFVPVATLTSAPQHHDAKQARTVDYLLNTPPGQFLRVRVVLQGGGRARRGGGGTYETPVIAAVRAHYPRNSYLEHLPAAFTEHDQDGRFLERLLAVFQREFDAIEDRVDRMPQWFDARTAPRAMLPLLGRWLAAPPRADDPTDRQRRALRGATQVNAAPGTRRSILAAASIALDKPVPTREPKCGDDDSPQPARPAEPRFPMLVEGFRERRRMELTADAELGQQAEPLWGPGVVGRLDPGSYDRLDEVRLVDTGDAERDVFHEHAHRFRVLVPASWVRGQSDLVRLREAIRAAAPAHTRFDVTLVEPAMRLGVQSTLGVDTVIAAEPARDQLTGGGEGDGDGDGGEDGGGGGGGEGARLGVDAVVRAAGPCGGRAFRAGAARVGTGTVLS